MNIAALPAGESVFIDANVFIYDFGADPLFGPPSRAFLKRIETGQIQGYTSSLVLHNFAHRAMTLEACQTLGWSYAGIARRLRDNPAEIRKLFRFRRMMDAILGMGVEVLDVNAEHILLASDVSRTHGLLSGDALIVEMMWSRSLVNLVSADEDFDRVPGLVRYAPI